MYQEPYPVTLCRNIWRKDLLSPDFFVEPELWVGEYWKMSFDMELLGSIIHIYSMVPTAWYLNWKQKVSPLDHQAPDDLGVSKPHHLQYVLGVYLQPAEKTEAVL